MLTNSLEHACTRQWLQVSSSNESAWIQVTHSRLRSQRAVSILRVWLLPVQPDEHRELRVEISQPEVVEQEEIVMRTPWILVEVPSDYVTGIPMATSMRRLKSIHVSPSRARA